MTDVKFNKIISAVQGMGVMAIARMIGTKRIDPSKILSKEDLILIIRRLGKTQDDAFEMHIDRIPGKMKSIRSCVKGGDAESAIVLLYMLIEGEVNTVIRMILRVRGFSHAAVSEVIRGVNLKTKFDLVLPLLQVKPSSRICQLAMEAQRIRNLVVHFKAKPDVLIDDGNQIGDYYSVKEKAINFLERNSLKDIGKILRLFVDDCIFSCIEIRQAHELLFRFDRGGLDVSRYQ